MTTRLVDAMLAMSASFLRDGRVDAPPAEGGGQDSDGTPGPGSPQVTPSTRRAPRRVLPGHGRIRGKTTQAACRSACGSGSLGASLHQHPRASIAVRVRKPRSTGLHILTVGLHGQGAREDLLLGAGGGE